MFCQRCGLEISAGANFCIGCGSPAAPTPQMVQPPSVKSSNALSVIAIIVVSMGALFFFCVVAAIAIPNFLLAKNKSRFTSCIQSMNAVSLGLQNYLSEKGDFNGLIGGSGEQICNYILPGYDNARACAGKVPAKMKENCLVYNIDVNVPAPFQYEIVGQSNEKMICGICVTEDGYCPTRYTGKEPQDSRCIQSCAEAGPTTPAVCLH